MDETAPHWSHIETFLRGRGAAETAHPGGTLLEHLRRVRQLLADWGAGVEVQMAGLCHAAYGTEGFDHALLPVTQRPKLAALIGDRGEALVYLYGSCDRAAVYPQIEQGQPVRFRDRYTGRDHAIAEADLRAFMEITAANELDVLAHNQELAEKFGAELRRLFARAGTLLSPAARKACTERLAHA